MCNRSASDIRKAGLELEFYGFEEWSETRINVVLEVFPKSFAPIIQLDENGAKRWSRMRWGLPGPSSMGGAPVTNIRNVASPHWPPTGTSAPLPGPVLGVQRVRGQFAQRRESVALVRAAGSIPADLRRNLADVAWGLWLQEGAECRRASAAGARQSDGGGLVRHGRAGRMADRIR